MAPNFINRYASALSHKGAGQSYSKIMYYFVPELISAFFLNSLQILIEAQFIVHLKSTSLFATFAVTSTLILVITKMAEGLSTGIVIIGGQYNGSGKLREVGITAGAAFLLTCCVGFLIALLLFSGAGAIYHWYGVPADMISEGIPFLRLRAISIFLTFLYYALVGFLRSIKNTRVPMYFFVSGSIICLIADYMLIFGKGGAPALGFEGQAYATIIQYSFMVIGMIIHISYHPAYAKYHLQTIRIKEQLAAMWQLIKVSWPVIIEKTLMAATKPWLARLIAPIGAYAIGSFGVIYQMEMLAFVPAAAFGQVITFLVSNDYGKQDWNGIKYNIKKVLALAAFMVCTILFILSLNPMFFIAFYDPNHAFTDFASAAFPIISVLVFFDIVQLILSGALRGAGDVKTVLWVRLVLFFVCFLPASYYAAHLPIDNMVLKFIMIYGSFYIFDGIMSLVYIYRFHGDKWKQHIIS
jgi:MATE family multidrug resistance protein